MPLGLQLHKSSLCIRNKSKLNDIKVCIVYISAMQLWTATPKLPVKSTYAYALAKYRTVGYLIVIHLSFTIVVSN